MDEKKFYGLKEQEVQKSRRLYGNNELAKRKRISFIIMFLANFRSFIVCFLAFALVVKTALFFYMDRGKLLDIIILGVAFILATMISTVLNYYVQNDAIKRQEAAEHIKINVMRNGHLVSKWIEELVVGDIVKVSIGDKVPADCKLVKLFNCKSIKVDQSFATGESDEKEKLFCPEDYVPEHSEKNQYMVCRGSMVTEGEAYLEVLYVGGNTIYGKTNNKMASKMRIKLSPITPQLNKANEKLTMIATVVGIIAMFMRIALMMIDVGGWSAFWNLSKGEIIDDFVTAFLYGLVIVIAVAPEGLEMIQKITLALNNRKMAKVGVRIMTVEGGATMGYTDVVISDKTGTLTENKHRVIAFVNGEGKKFDKLSDMQDAFKTKVVESILGNANAEIQHDGNIAGGNATERAILEFVKDFKDTVTIERGEIIPFNSKEKFSATYLNGLNIWSIKGAAEKLLPKCKSYYDENGEVKPLTSKAIRNLEEEMNKMMDRTMRVLSIVTSNEGVERDNMIFVGFVGIRDNIRMDAMNTVADYHKSKIRFIMATGDGERTAKAIALECGILDSKDPEESVLTHEEFANMTDEEALSVIPNLKVLARSEPDDKLRLVELFHKLDKVVCMIGDGANDAPALVASDLGIAMGAGCALTQAVADVVCDNNSLADTYVGHSFGRTFVKNIQKFVNFQMSIAVIAMLVLVFIPLVTAAGQIMGFMKEIADPLIESQTLFVNLVMDTFAGIAFSGGPVLAEYMLEKPMGKNASLISKKMLSQMITMITYITAVCFAFFMIPGVEGLFENELHYYSAFFTLFIFMVTLNGLNIRTDKMNLLYRIKENRTFCTMIPLILILQIIIVIFVGEGMRCTNLTILEWLGIVAFSCTVLIVDLIRKKIQNKQVTDSSTVHATA